MKAFSAPILLAAALLLAPLRGFALSSFEAGAFITPTGGLNDLAKATAVDKEGCIWFVAGVNSTDQGDTWVARLRPDLFLEWEGTYGDGNGVNVPFGIVTVGDTAFVCGRNDKNPTWEGFVMAIGPGGHLNWTDNFGTTSDAYIQGARDIVYDSVTGDIFVVGTVDVNAHVRQLSRDGAYHDEYNFNHFGNQARGMALGITEDAIYVAGCAYRASNSTLNSWITKVDRASRTQVWSVYLDDAYSVPSPGISSVVVSLAVRGGLVFALINRMEATNQKMVVMRINPENGMPSRMVDLSSLPTTPAGEDVIDAGEVILHPTMPVVIAGDVMAANYAAYDLDLNEIFKAGVNASCPRLRGLAASPGPRSYFYAAVQVEPVCTSNNFARGLFRYALKAPSDDTPPLIVAPNFMDRSAPGSAVNFSIKSDQRNTDVKILIYDSAGHYVTHINAKFDDMGICNARWDGIADGKYVAPGTYYAAVSGGGVNKRKPFMIGPKGSRK